MTSSLSSSLFRELRPNFFGVLASPSARLYVDVLKRDEALAVGSVLCYQAPVQLCFKKMARLLGRAEKCK